MFSFPTFALASVVHFSAQGIGVKRSASGALSMLFFCGNTQLELERGASMEQDSDYDRRK